MTSEALSIYKLMILYTLNKIKQPIPQNLVSDFVTTYKYTDYFTISEAFSDLLKNGFITEVTTYNLSYYSISDSGYEALKTLGNELSPEIRNEIDTYIKDNNYEIINKASLSYDYQKVKDGSYLTTCSLKENNNIIFQIQLDTPNEDSALKVCENWKTKCADIYQFILSQLNK